MPTTTDEIWKFDGVDLNQYCWNIASLTGRTRFPSKRGDNIKVPYRHGGLWVPKWADENQISLAMWVIGTDEDGVISDDTRALFNDNWHALARLFWTEGALHAVEKTWRSVGGNVTATAEAEVSEGVDVTIEGVTRGVFTVDLRIPDVWFFGEEMVEEIPLATPTVIDNPGDASLAWMQIDFEGPLTNPQLTNSSTDPEVWAAMGGSIGAGEVVTYDTKEFTAVNDIGDNIIGAVSRSGYRNWMLLLPGPNTLTLTATAGSGTATVRYRPPYF